MTPEMISQTLAFRYKTLTHSRNQQLQSSHDSLVIATVSSVIATTYRPTTQDGSVSRHFCSVGHTHLTLHMVTEIMIMTYIGHDEIHHNDNNDDDSDVANLLFSLFVIKMIPREKSYSTFTVYRH